MGKAVRFEKTDKGPCLVSTDHVVALWAAVGGLKGTIIALAGGHEVRAQDMIVQEVAERIGWSVASAARTPER